MEKAKQYGRCIIRRHHHHHHHQHRQRHRSLAPAELNHLRLDNNLRYCVVTVASQLFHFHSRPTRKVNRWKRTRTMDGQRMNRNRHKDKLIVVAFRFSTHTNADEATEKKSLKYFRWIFVVGSTSARAIGNERTASTAAAVAATKQIQE